MKEDTVVTVETIIHMKSKSTGNVYKALHLHGESYKREDGKGYEARFTGTSQTADEKTVETLPVFDTANTEGSDGGSPILSPTVIFLLDTPATLLGLDPIKAMMGAVVPNLEGLTGGEENEG